VATNGIRLVRPRKVTGDADGLVTHAGVVWLGEIADQSGLTAGLCRATSGLSRRRHHPGVTLTQMTIALADGATCVSDLVTFRRQRGRAEGIVRDVKACGLANLPFDGIANNELWMQLCFTANDLLAWGRRISLDGPMRRATPKTIRYRLLHTAGRTSPRHHRLHLDRTWPWTPTLITAIDRIQCRLTAAQPTA
jgi:Transposase DDE domain group 1